MNSKLHHNMRIRLVAPSLTHELQRNEKQKEKESKNQCALRWKANWGKSAVKKRAFTARAQEDFFASAGIAQRVSDARLRTSLLIIFARTARGPRAWVKDDDISAKSLTLREINSIWRVNDVRYFRLWIWLAITPFPFMTIQITSSATCSSTPNEA